MIAFIKEQNQLVLRYVPENASGDWLVEPLKKDAEIPVSARTFFLRQEIYLPHFKDSDYAMDVCYHFTAGTLKADNYFLMDKQLLGIDFSLYLHKSLTFKRSTFVANTNISIFQRFGIFKLKEIWIGGPREDSLPTEVFEEMLRRFPTTTEVKRYASARICSIVRDYLPIEEDHQAKYEKFLNTKNSRNNVEPQNFIAPYESEKFTLLIEKLEVMLADPVSYTESRWQEEILQVIILLFPRYIKAFAEGPVNDSWANAKRRVDFLLVDASGYIDVIEIKKPGDQKLVTSNCYRDNHVPMRELGGTIMQVEKYLYHFNRWGEVGERKLNEKYQPSLPDGLEVKIVNPNGMIIMGRANDLTIDQKNDFEVIRRKYRNVMDIITYDDLLRRLKVIRDHFKSRVE